MLVAYDGRSVSVLAFVKLLHNACVSFGDLGQVVSAQVGIALSMQKLGTLRGMDGVKRRLRCNDCQTWHTCNAWCIPVAAVHEGGATRDKAQLSQV
jgi:hypothetical protein